jgi:uncharacterized membrane protein (UPF0127 family)
MIKQLVIPLVAVAAFIIVVGLFLKNSPKFALPGIPTPIATTGVKSVKIGDTVIQVEVSDTPEARAKGLSGRTDIIGDSGMLFTFDSSDQNPVFWMKDMLIAIDIVWIKDGAVIKIDKNVPFPKPGTPDDSLIRYSPGKSIDHVLELRAGYSDQNGIIVGSKVDLSKI